MKSMNGEYLNYNLHEIKEYLDENGIDSSWVEKSDFLKKIFENNTPVNSIVFSHLGKELTSRVKDVRGIDVEAENCKYNFYEIGNVVIMEKLGISIEQYKEISDEYEYLKSKERFRWNKNTYYLDKVDGSFLAGEYRFKKSHAVENAHEKRLFDDDFKFDTSFENELYGEDPDIKVSYKANEDEIKRRMNEFPGKYLMANNVMEIVSNINKLKSEKEKNKALAGMLNKLLGFAEKVRDSKIGYLFFGKAVNEVLGKKDMNQKEIGDGR